MRSVQSVRTRTMSPGRISGALFSRSATLTPCQRRRRADFDVAVDGPHRVQPRAVQGHDDLRRDKPVVDQMHRHRPAGDDEQVGAVLVCEAERGLERVRRKNVFRRHACSSGPHPLPQPLLPLRRPDRWRGGRGGSERVGVGWGQSSNAKKRAGEPSASRILRQGAKNVKRRSVGSAPRLVIC